MSCPRCISQPVVINGTSHHRKQEYQCHECYRQSIGNPSNQSIPVETKDLINKLRLEKIPLAGITPVGGVSERWLQYYANPKYDSTSNQVDVTKKKQGRLTIWSVVDNHHNKP